jgi:hypothetical protein
MSYERTEASMLAIHGVEISQGGMDQIMRRSGQKGQQGAEKIQSIVQQSAVVNSDETVAHIEWLCDRLLARTVTQPEVRKLQKRYLKHRKHLFVFLYQVDVPPTNKVGERTLRPSVVHRKVAGGFRSLWGANTYTALASVIDTAALKGANALDAIQSLVGKPALPLPSIHCE